MREREVNAWREGKRASCERCVLQCCGRSHRRPDDEYPTIVALGKRANKGVKVL